MIVYEITDNDNASVYLSQENGEKHIAIATNEEPPGIKWVNGWPQDPNVREVVAKWIVTEIQDSGQITPQAASALVDLAANNVRER